MSTDLFQRFQEDCEFAESFEQVQGLLGAYRKLDSMNADGNIYVMVGRIVGLFGNPLDREFYSLFNSHKYKKQKALINKWWLSHEWYYYSGDTMKPFDYVVVIHNAKYTVLKRTDYVSPDDSVYDLLNAGVIS